ncbi:MAG: pyruvate kinase [Candidatus Pacebacteria bacterium]|nr:pyruvate kinase [Candidatus Paceibacterota bacterium]MDD3728904.1 pyruvate kinase [Candidatus Paceibacterota bacterium]MDD4201477.1 pyruvate kinase [Candidatus Paceibacterota bacterium]MDD4897753.1 pyruvate kinase [Candidatus Paceibacterota bacterium]MDD5445788.1 pyruvate kinase [Candidatus Paceibacterota bacterium]
MIFDKKTKIVATVGPSTDTPELLRSLISAGVNVFRFNTKHNEISWHNQRIKRAQKAATELKKNIAILIDLQGPEIRIETREKGEIKVEKGDLITIGENFNSRDISLALSNKSVFESLSKKDILLIDDGFIEFVVMNKKKDRIIAEVIEGGVIKDKKSLNLPSKNLNLSSLIENDLKSLDMIAKEKIDYVALSFVRNKKDIEVLRREMEKRKINAEIVSKIENKQAIDNLEEIIEYSDAVMVARGDLGIEVPIERLAYLQRKIVYKCMEARKPVIIATQMLYSMIKNPRPTRAEATDVANAVFNRADAVMLSEETAIGQYPIRAVETMAKILKFNEKKTGFSTLSFKLRTTTELTISAVVSILKARPELDIVVVFTESGYTARVLSSFRPKTKIIALTNNRKTAEKLSLSCGVEPFFVSFDLASPEAIKNTAEKLRKEKLIAKGKKLLIVSGEHKGRKDIINSFSFIRI